ncbi:hypothetical protein ACIQNU_01110 [Streptomyces sp. NPDC091292]|uniref:hypothetical protein n=1 Tax=Streptomyces sp. NPDC091292 TaxID=3365991 RepID=UPI0037F6FC8C
MRRGLVHVLAWSLATGAAVTLSWWGVHTVLAGTAYDPPRALPITGALGQGSEPLSSSTRRADDPPSPSASPSGAKPSPDGRPSKKAPSGKPSASARTTPPAPAPKTPAPSGRVKSYTTEGGRAAFELGDSAATLVSATPAAGWSMQVWTEPTWIRVEFSSGADRVSVFCTWHDHAPLVEINTY